MLPLGAVIFVGLESASSSYEVVRCKPPPEGVLQPEGKFAKVEVCVVSTSSITLIRPPVMSSQERYVKKPASFFSQIGRPRSSLTATVELAELEPFCAVVTAGCVVVTCSGWIVPLKYVYAFVYVCPPVVSVLR